VDSLKGDYLLTSDAITNLSRRLFSVMLVNNINFNSEFEYFKILLIQNTYCTQMSRDFIRLSRIINFLSQRIKSDLEIPTVIVKPSYLSYQVPQL
jgi:hypothetical protein